MCGIAGIMLREGGDSPRQVKPQQIDSFIQALKHRGPDGYGTFMHNGLALIHTRLSIVDLNTGQQPLKDAQGRVLIANGEIYNNPELRETYASYPYKTHSDCEAILMLWARYGAEAVKYLRGMYAFALYDPSEQALYIARDPYGIKPLYYVQNSEGFFFASEIQALIAAGAAESRLYPQGLRELLQLRFSTGENTVFSQVKRLLPGECFKIIDGQVVARYRTEGITSFFLSESSGEIEDLSALLSDSVRVHLRSDVPYGLFLSGGIDSSAMLALMKDFHTGPLKTYSIGFPDTQMHDERMLARKMAESVGAEHTDISFTEQDFWTLLPEVAKALDDPVIDYAALPTYKLAREAARDVKVVLCGEGGDEVFAGYRRYQRARRPRIFGGRLWRERGIFKDLKSLNFDLEGWDHSLRATVEDLKKKPYSALQKAQAVDFEHWLPDDLLTKLDRCLMVHGVEGRTPFVDKEVAPYGFFLNDHHKVSWGKGKILLRRWLAEKFPPAEPFAKKRGFNVPIKEWILKRRESVLEWVENQEGVRELASPEQIQKFFGKQLEKDVMPAWILLFYSVWHQQHVLNKPVSGRLFEQ